MMKWGGPPSPWCCKDKEVVAQPQQCCRHPSQLKTESTQAETQWPLNQDMSKIKQLEMKRG